MLFTKVLLSKLPNACLKKSKHKKIDIISKAAAKRFQEREYLNIDLMLT